MSSRGILYFTLFLAVAGITGIFLRAWLAAEEPEAVAETVPEPKPSVLVALRDLEVGAFLTPEDVGWAEWTGPSAIVLTQHFIEGANQIPEVVGAVVRQPIVRDAPVTAAAIIKPGQRGFLAAVLRSGMRAVSVPIDQVSGNSGLIFPGDYVDVILTVQIDDREKGQGSRLAGETILRNLRVIAMGRRVEALTTLDADVDERSTTMARTATLEVSPEHAERLTVASHVGRLALSLRPLSEPEHADLAAGGTLPEAAPRAVWAADVATALKPRAAPPAEAQRERPRRPPLVLMRGGQAPEVMSQP